MRRVMWPAVFGTPGFPSFDTLPGEPGRGRRWVDEIGVVVWMDQSSDKRLSSLKLTAKAPSTNVYE